MLLGLGLQHKTVDELAVELDLQASQLLGLFNRTIRRITQHLSAITEKAISDETFPALDGDKVVMEPLKKTLDQDLVSVNGAWR